MPSVVFYSWQSDLPNSTNRSFIQRALEKAARSIGADDTVKVEPVIDRDTAGVPGSPDIAATILQKIDDCEVFVCDISIVNARSRKRPTPNPNVLIELGYALKSLGWSRIVMVFNLAEAPIEKLPFDLRLKRVITYKSRARETDRVPERQRLASTLTGALREIYTQRPSNFGTSWEGIELQGVFFAWDGPFLGLDDKKGIPAPAGLLGQLEEHSLSMRWANEDSLPRHIEKGRYQVFATDRKSWRRPVKRGRQFLLVAPLDQPD